MKYGIRLKACLKKEFDKNPVYENKYITAKLNNTKFEHRILKKMNVVIYP